LLGLQLVYQPAFPGLTAARVLSLYSFYNGVPRYVLAEPSRRPASEQQQDLGAFEDAVDNCDAVKVSVGLLPFRCCCPIPVVVDEGCFSGFFHPFSFPGAYPKLGRGSPFPGFWLPNILGKPLIFSREARITYSHSFGSQKRLHFTTQGAASTVLVPRLVGGGCGGRCSGIRLRYGREISTVILHHPAIKPSTHVLCGCHGINKPAQTQCVASSARGICIVHSSGSAQVHAANRGLFHQLRQG
jgi:hypothetical protein